MTRQHDEVIVIRFNTGRLRRAVAAVKRMVSAASRLVFQAFTWLRNRISRLLG